MHLRFNGPALQEQRLTGAVKRCVERLTAYSSHSLILLGREHVAEGWNRVAPIDGGHAPTNLIYIPGIDIISRTSIDAPGAR